MNDHYYTNVPQSASRPSEFTLEFDGTDYRFCYDNGVFSKGELDTGTRILLSALPPLRGRILDLGCGWGPVGVILGHKYPEASIVMSDVNSRAVELAEKNLSLNGITNARVVCCDGFSALDGKFDHVITNPPIRAGKQVIYRMFDDALARLNPGGKLYIVIRRQQGAESALAHLAGAYARVIDKDKGFWVIECGGNENE